MNLLHTLRRDRSWLAALMLPLLLFRALVPTGFMPVASHDGRLVMQLCVGTGPSAPSSELPSSPVVPLPDSSQFPVPLDNHVGHDTLCPFAASAAAALVPPTLEVHLARFAVAANSSFSFDAPARPAIWRAHSPRGPPSLV